MEYIKIRLRSDLGQVEPGINKSNEAIYPSINPMFTFSKRPWKPQMDLYEGPDEIIIHSELSGAAKEDINLEINTRAVRIYGKRSSNYSMKDTKYHLAEIQYGTFERILFLPTPINTENVEASYTNGLLTIRMYKRPIDRIQKVPIKDG